MGKDVCTFMPTVKGKASKLFNELKKRTNSQSPAAFLYAIAQDEAITSQFTKRDFDSNGQLLYKSFAEKFNLNNFIATNAELVDERKKEGVVNASGNQVVFKDPDALYTKITTYNDSQDRFRMKMRWNASAGGFVVDLDRIGIDNYKTNEIMQADMARFRGYLSYLEKVLGKPVQFNDSLRTTFANFANVRYFADVVKNLAKSLKKFGKNLYLTENQAALLLAFHGDSLLGQRILSVFGDNTVSALVETSRLKDGDPDEMDPGLRELLRNFIGFAANKATAAHTLASGFSTRDDSKFFEEYGRKAVEDAHIEGKSYFNVAPEKLSDIINELKSKYLIDKEIKNGSLRAINSLSDAAANLMQVNIRQMEKMERLGIRDEDYVHRMDTYRKYYNRGKYLDSIAGMLNLADESLSANAAVLNEAVSQIEEGSVVSSIKGLNHISSAILNTLKLGSALGDVLENLARLKGLEIDENDPSNETMELVQKAAENLSKNLKDQIIEARRKQLSVLYAFYLPIWGGTDVKVDPQGGEHSLRTILETLAEDPNILDRLIYSLNESNDEALGLLHQAVLDRQRSRDETMRKIDFFIRQKTDDLYQTNRTSSFMFEVVDGELTGRIIDPYGISKYKEARKKKIEELKEKNLSDEQFRQQLYAWEKANTKDVSPFGQKAEYKSRYEEALREVVKTVYGSDNYLDYAIDIIKVPIASYEEDKLSNLSEAELRYYFSMMALKSVIQNGMPNYDTNFFEAPQITNDFISTIIKAGSSPAKMFSAMSNYFNFNSKRIDENYEETLGDLLHGNGYKRVLEDIDGSELMRLPLFFTHRLKDRSNMSTDFSRTMLAMSSAAVNYNELNTVLDTLMLTKEWLLNNKEGRQQDKVEGERKLVDLFKWGKDIFMQSVMKEQNSESSLVIDFFEKDVFGKLKKDEEISLFGTTVKLDKAADWLTGFTSRTGLTVNILGAQANALVGKLQMTIEGACGQYFDLGDLGYAEIRYWQMVMPYLMEYNSNNKTSLLGLLSDKFNVMEGYYQDLKQKGFQISALGKILSNTNLFLLYGMGEHMLHNETMLAIMHRIKVRKKGTDEEINLLQAYEKYGLKGDERNKIVDLNVDDFEIFVPGTKSSKDSAVEGTWRNMTKDDELRVEKQISYCNKTMHGAFSDAEKGMAHRYAFGRLVLNFRQWMPGHYGRRYRSMHYDADLGEYVSGFYQSAFKFVVDTVNDLKRAKFDIGTRWKELSEEEKANIKRAIAETSLLVMLMVQNMCLGEYKDKRGNWAYRNLMYQTKRMLMEVRASTLLSGFGPQGFINNMLSMLNSPIAAMTTIEDIVNLMNLSKLFITIEGGRYDGENLYLHNLKRRIPYIGQIIRQANIGEEDYIFQVFE